MARAYEKHEVVEMLLASMHAAVTEWDKADRATCREKLDGLAFSILGMLDGVHCGLPAFDLVPSPHPDDHAYREAEGENWFPEVVINDVMLHDEWYPGETDHE